MSKPSPGALRAAETIYWKRLSVKARQDNDPETLARLIDQQTALPEFIQLAYMIQQGRRLHDYCNPCPTCGEKADRLVAQAEAREGT